MKSKYYTVIFDVWRAIRRKQHISCSHYSHAPPQSAHLKRQNVWNLSNIQLHIFVYLKYLQLRARRQRTLRQSAWWTCRPLSWRNWRISSSQGKSRQRDLDQDKCNWVDKVLEEVLVCHYSSYVKNNTSYLTSYQGWISHLRWQSMMFMREALSPTRSLIVTKTMLFKTFVENEYSSLAKL